LIPRIRINFVNAERPTMTGLAEYCRLFRDVPMFKHSHLSTIAPHNDGANLLMGLRKPISLARPPNISPGWKLARVQIGAAIAEIDNDGEFANGMKRVLTGLRLLGSHLAVKSPAEHIKQSVYTSLVDADVVDDVATMNAKVAVGNAILPDFRGNTFKSVLDHKMRAGN